MPAEVVSPLVPSRVEKLGEPLGNRVDAGQVWPLAQVILVTGEGEIGRGIGAAMLAGDDVLDVEGEEGVVVLVKSAEFAAPLGAPADQLARGRVDHDAGESRARAFAWRMATTFAAMT